jgi:hypothetical protein
VAYRHFPSEVDLRSAVLDAGYSSLIESVEAALDTTDAESRPGVTSWSAGRPG